ncbi:hypothetical protein FKP32DRAFT_942680 [Trametes sanguinea]|nr:hypothetical protein FKP32DRAFT_942680 [Trametes sanguinea]
MLGRAAPLPIARIATILASEHAQIGKTSEAHTSDDPERPYIREQHEVIVAMPAVKFSMHPDAGNSPYGQDHVSHVGAAEYQTAWEAVGDARHMFRSTLWACRSERPMRLSSSHHSLSFCCEVPAKSQSRCTCPLVALRETRPKYSTQNLARLARRHDRVPVPAVAPTADQIRIAPGMRRVTSDPREMVARKRDPSRVGGVTAARRRKRQTKAEGGSGDRKV